MLLKIFLLFLGLGFLLLHERLINRKLLKLQIKSGLYASVNFILPYQEKSLLNQLKTNTLWHIHLQNLPEDLSTFAKTLQQRQDIIILEIDLLLEDNLARLEHLKSVPLRLAFLQIDSNVETNNVSWENLEFKLNHQITEIKHLFPNINFALRLPSEGKSLPKPLGQIWQRLSAEFQLYEISLFASDLAIKPDFKKAIRQIPNRHQRLKSQLNPQLPLIFSNADLANNFPESQTKTWADQLWQTQFLLSHWQIPSLRFVHLNSDNLLTQLLRLISLGQVQKIQSADYPQEVNGWLFRQDWRTGLVLVNLSEETQKVEMQHFFGQTFFYHQLFVEPSHLWEDTKDYPPKSKKGQTRAQISLPSYSISFLGLQASILWDLPQNNSHQLNITQTSENKVLLSYHLGQSANPTITVYNEQFSLIMRKSLKTQSKGKYQLHLKLKTGKLGIYYFHLETNTQESLQVLTLN